MQGESNMKYESPEIKIRRFEEEEYIVASSEVPTKTTSSTVSTTDAMGDSPDGDMF